MLVNRIGMFGNELNVLISTPRDDLARVSGDRTADLIAAVREGRVDVQAGFDGVYGTVKAIV